MWCKDCHETPNHFSHKLPPSFSQAQVTVQARLHDRKIGYGPDKERVRTSHFCPCKLCGSCLLAWVRTRVFFGFVAIGGYGPKNQKKKTRVPTSFLILASAGVIISLITCAVP